MTPLPLPLLFFSIALAPGTAESDPSTEGMMFKVRVAPGIATDFGIGGGNYFYVTLNRDGADSAVVIKRPLSYPVWIMEPDYEPMMRHRAAQIWAINGTILDVPYYRSPYVDRQDRIDSTGILLHNASASRCYDEYTVSLEPHARTLLVPLGDFLPPIPAMLVSRPMPAECAGQALLEPPFPPPRQQAHRHGIVPSTVACNEGLVPHLRGGEPLCLRPDTRDVLLGRGYIEPPPVPFVPSPPERPDAGRPRP